MRVDVAAGVAAGAGHGRNRHAAGAGAENGNVKGLDGAAAEARDETANPERAPAPLCHKLPRNRRTTSEPERRPFCST